MDNTVTISTLWIQKLTDTYRYGHHAVLIQMMVTAPKIWKYNFTLHFHTFKQNTCWSNMLWIKPWYTLHRWSFCFNSTSICWIHCIDQSKTFTLLLKSKKKWFWNLKSCTCVRYQIWKFYKNKYFSYLPTQPVLAWVAGGATNNILSGALCKFLLQADIFLYFLLYNYYPKRYPNFRDNHDLTRAGTIRSSAVSIRIRYGPCRYDTYSIPYTCTWLKVYSVKHWPLSNLCFSCRVSILLYRSAL